MMKRIIPLLSILLFVQIGLAAALSYSGPDYGAFKSDVKLVPSLTQGVDRIEISGAEGKGVVLEKRDDADRDPMEMLNGDVAITTVPPFMTN